MSCIKAKNIFIVNASESSIPLYCENLSQDIAPNANAGYPIMESDDEFAISLAAGIVILCGIIKSCSLFRKSSLLQNPVYSGASKIENTLAKSANNTKTWKLSEVLLKC